MPKSRQNPISDSLPALLRVWSILLVLACTPAAWAAEPTAHFDVLEYVVRGNSVLPRARIEATVYPFLGPKRGLDAVEKARAALEQAYHDAGYLTVFVNLPEQKVEHGLVRLDVVEGKVERLRVAGSRYYSLGEIKAQVPELDEGSVPNFNDVQKQLTELNRNPGRRVAPILRAGRVPGLIEAELKVEDQNPLHASVEVNDRYSRDTSLTRLNASLRYDNLWQSAHSLNLNFQVAPEKPAESKVLVATYMAPLASGNTLAVYTVASDSDVATVGDINSLGKGNILGLRYVLPLRARPGLLHSLTLGTDYKDYKDTTRQNGVDASNVPITYLPFSLGYDLTLAGTRRSTQIGLSSVFSLRDVVSNQGEFDAKRPGSHANFFYFKGDLRQTWQFGEGLSLQVRLSRQYTQDPLVNNEQMAAGGVDSVRGYPESAVLGDSGWLGGLEMRTPNLAGRWAPGLSELSLSEFAEGAHLTSLATGYSEQSKFSLASMGLGLRFRAGKTYSGSLDYARALKDAGGVQAGDDRIHFRLGAEW